MCKQNKPCNLQVKGRDLPWLGQVWYCMFSVHTPSVSRENILYIGGVTIRRYRTEQPAFTYTGAYLTTNFIGRGSTCLHRNAGIGQSCHSLLWGDDCRPRALASAWQQSWMPGWVSRRSGRLKIQTSHPKRVERNMIRPATSRKRQAR